MSRRARKIAVAGLLVAGLIGGLATLWGPGAGNAHTTVVAYFDNTNGLYVDDNVVILGVPVGRIEKIEPEPSRVKVTFWYDNRYKAPANVNAVILSPTLVTARTIQLTPAYTNGPTLADHAVIPFERTAVPVEWDDFRQQLERLAQTLQPTRPGGVSTLGDFVNTAADNLRNHGTDIRDTIIKLSEAISAVSDHSKDLFGTLRNLSTLVSALQDSSDLLKKLNQNLAATTRLIVNDPNQIAHAVRDLSQVADDVATFVAENKEALGVTSDKLAAVSKAAADSRDDIKEVLHTVPPAANNFLNIYQPAQGTLSGILALNNFANPLQFLCGAVQAASRRSAEESAKLCVQYLAPIIKNRQYNFLPLGINPFVGASARPNEITYSEDYLRPDYVPPAGSPPPNTPAEPDNSPPLTAALGNAPAGGAVATKPEDGLQGLMLPPGGGR